MCECVKGDVQIKTNQTKSRISILAIQSYVISNNHESKPKKAGYWSILVIFISQALRQTILCYHHHLPKLTIHQTSVL